jgi:hypothetical protein
VIVINHGKLLFDESLSTLRARFIRHKRVTLLGDKSRLELNLPGVKVLESEPYKVLLEVVSHGDCALFGTLAANQPARVARATRGVLRSGVRHVLEQPDLLFLLNFARAGAGALAVVGVALLAFQRGLRRYESGNQIGVR